MRRMDQYLSTINTIYPDGYTRETYVRDAGDMLDPRPLAYPHNGGPLSRLWTAFRVWREKRQGRLVLRELSDEMLKDIGVSPAEARQEAGRSFFLD